MDLERFDCSRVYERIRYTIPNSLVSLRGSLALDTVTVTCSEPHVLIGQREVTCQSNGEWSELPQCRKYGNLDRFFVTFFVTTS